MNQNHHPLFNLNNRHSKLQNTAPTLNPPNLPVRPVGLGGLVSKDEPPVHLVEAALLERLLVRRLAPQLNVVPQKGLTHAAEGSSGTVQHFSRLPSI